VLAEDARGNNGRAATNLNFADADALALACGPTA
jgi:hypothetical protein